MTDTAKVYHTCLLLPDSTYHTLVFTLHHITVVAHETDDAAPRNVIDSKTNALACWMIRHFPHGNGLHVLRTYMYHNHLKYSSITLKMPSAEQSLTGSSSMK